MKNLNFKKRTFVTENGCFLSSKRIKLSEYANAPIKRTKEIKKRRHFRQENFSESSKRIKLDEAAYVQLMIKKTSKRRIRARQLAEKLNNLVTAIFYAKIFNI